MANHKSAEKRARQTIVKTQRNKIRKTQSRSVIKSLRTAIESKDKETATSLLGKAQSLLSKLAKHGTIKANTAARKTSRLASQVSKL